MKMTFAFACSIFLGLGLTGTMQAKEKEKWVCLKDGAEIKVKGKKAEDKGKDCETKGGTWEKSADEPAKEQSSGSGGAW